ncbi:MAG TPA: hypothetical protein VMZ71_00645 [Gemmataceae bacterium]|nr:hypothetical protein [Gemmataceae bacterium]
MNGVVFTFPDDVSPDALPEWLDWHVVTPGLGQLVAELTAIHGRPARETTLDSLLAGHRQRVLDGGLRELPRDVLSKLLKQPALLVELRDLVFSHGGDYWDRIDPEEMPPERIERIVDEVTATVTQEKATPRAPSVPFYKWPLVVGFATAAAVLLGVYLIDWRNRPPAGGGGGVETVKATGVQWGWASSDGIPKTGTDAETFAHLGKKAKQWFDERPETPLALAQRVAEFRQGCTSLQLSETLPLSEKEKTDLLARCAKWSAEFDVLLTRLEQTRDVPAVRKDADDLVNKLTKYLEGREQAARG